MAVAIAVEYEVVADFDLSTQADIHVVHTLQLVEVEPELRFAQHDELATDILVVPDINETREGAEPVSKRVAPDARQLETIEGTAIGPLEIILVEGLKGERLREIAAGPVPGETTQEGMLEAVADARMLDGRGTTVIFYMKGKGRLLAQLEFAGYLPVDTCSTVREIVDIGKHKRATPLVGLKHFDGSGDIGTS